MNINVLMSCNICNKLTHCRIGLSYNHSQSLRFVCASCMSPIDIKFKYKTSLKDSSIELFGATDQSEQTLNNSHRKRDIQKIPDSIVG
jgi:transposase-like protein